MDVIYQKPAAGISQTGKFENSGAISYRVDCECNTPSHSVDVWLEVTPDKEYNLVELTIYANLWTPLYNGFLDRIKASWNILFKGVHKQQHSILLTEQTALNFAETIKNTIYDLKAVDVKSKK